MAAMDELGSLLQSLQTLKAPGVTPTKVKAITAICVENIQVCWSLSPLFFQRVSAPTAPLLSLRSYL